MLNENSNRSVSNAGLGDRSLNGVRDLVGAFALGRDCKLIVMNSHEAKPGGGWSIETKDSNGCFGKRRAWLRF